MKKHNILKVVLITIIVFLILSWILPAAYYSGQYVDQGRVQMGLYEIFNYPLTALSYFGYITLFIIFVGGFYGVLYKIPAYRTFLDKVVALFKGKENIFLSAIVVILALGVSICGLQFGFIIFIPFIVSLILLLGYDKIVAAMTVVGSMAVGLAGSTYSYTNLNILTSSLSLDLDYQIGVRIIILLAGIALVIFNTLVYANNYMKNVKIEAKPNKKKTVTEEVKEEKVKAAPKKKAAATKTTKASAKSKSTKTSTSSKTKASTSKSKTTSKTRASSSRKNNKAALRDEDIIVIKESVISDSANDSYLVPKMVEKTHKIWPFVAGFCLLFILSIMAFITWGEGGFGITAFEKATKAVSEFKLFGFPIFAKIYGTMNAFGTWTIIDMFLPMALLVLLLCLVYKIKFDDLLDGFAEGAKKALLPALISILVYAILVLVTYHPFQMTLYKAILGISKGFNIATTTVVAILASLFNGDISYVYQSVLPYYVSVVTNADNYAIVGVIFQSMYGFTMLFAPTSLILMGTLAYLNVSYKDWLKNIWKLLLELFIVLLIVFIIIALV